MNQSILENKKAKVEEIATLVKDSKSVIVLEYRGLTVQEIATLKRDLKKENAKMTVYKNRLVKIAVDNLGLKDLDQYLEGPNAFVAGADETTAAKIVAKFANKHENLVIKAGIVDGRVVDKNEVITLSNLPNKEGMISMLLSVLQAPVRGLAVSLKAVADKQ